VFHKDYHYRAAQTQDVLDGMDQFVDGVEMQLGLVKGRKVLDIGCNDGSLLNVFKKRGAITTGIEPTDAATEAAAAGHGVDQAFFDPREAFLYVKTYGSPDIITFTNVFAHINNLTEVIACLNIIKKPTTSIVIENHYLGSVLERHQFDTFYHEHPRTYSHTSFVYIARALGMDVTAVDFPARYGGNIRVYMEPTHGYELFMPREEEFGQRLAQLGQQVNVWKARKRVHLLSEVARHGTLGAAAFPARASILIRMLDLHHRHILAVFEKEGSKKIGYYVPGTRIPIMSDEKYDFARSTTDTPLLNLAWHIPLEIEARWRSRGFKGHIIPAVSDGDFK
jgi:SAM-dependent methyltransferase